ncbi:MAG: glycosyltransferase family 39 protein [bacterium]|nr:glycosyltransferase family 39 protein [bacterium]
MILDPSTWLSAHAPHDLVWRRRALLLIAGAAVFRLLCLLLVPMQLVPDEAYYWDWSRQLAWCYYSKPPMVAWLIAGATHLLGTAEWSVRLPAALLNVVTLGLLYLLGAAMFSRAAGFCAALAFVVTPATFAAGFFMTIDAPLLCAWSLALLCTWHALHCTRGAAGWWLGAGLAVAAGIFSKQMMLLFPLLLLIFIALNRAYWPALRRASFYLVPLCTALALVPLLWWNAQHDWVMLQHTAGHFQSTRPWYAFCLSWLHFIGTQAGMISPLLWLLLVAVGLLTLRHYYAAPPAARFLAVFSIVPLAGIMLLSLRQRILPNWPAVFYLAGCILAAAAVSGAFAIRTRAALLARAFPWALAVGAVEITGTLLVVAVIGLTGWGERLLEKELSGWRTLGAAVHAAAQTLPKPATTMLMTFDRGLTAELAFYVPGRPQVYHWTLDIVVWSQYGVWMNQGFDQDKRGWDALLVASERQRLPFETNRFARVEFLRDIRLAEGSRVYKLYHATNLRHWPALQYRLHPRP